MAPKKFAGIAFHGSSVGITTTDCVNMDVLMFQVDVADVKLIVDFLAGKLKTLKAASKKEDDAETSS